MGPTRVDELLSRAVEADVAERRALREALEAVAARLGAVEAALARIEAGIASVVARSVPVRASSSAVIDVSDEAGAPAPNLR